MLQDRFRKKTKGPGPGGSSSLETTDISDQVPEVDDVLAGVDKALKLADSINEQMRREQSKSQGGCTC